MRRLLVAALAAVSIACGGDGLSGIVSPGHAVVFGLVRGPTGRAVSGALVNASMRGENCTPPDIAVGSIRTDAAGRYRVALSAPAELVGTSACVFLTVTPPAQSGLQGRTLPSPRVQIHSVTQVADSVRVDVTLTSVPGPPPGNP